MSDAERVGFATYHTAGLSLECIVSVAAVIMGGGLTTLDQGTTTSSTSF